MNQPPNQGPNVPPGYGTPNVPPGYGPQPGYMPQSGPMPGSASYPPQTPYPQPHGIRGMTRQIFNPAAYRQAGSGSWAAASLILSLVSAFFCLGMISPLPMILGLVGLVGNKRAKGMAFAGFLISALQVCAWVLLMAFGMHQVYWAEEYASNAGSPVVAAIGEFKKDNQRVPYSLEELVENGYLPPTWVAGTDDLPSAVKNVVDGKKWSEFLRYQAGGNEQWDGAGWVDAVARGSELDDDWNDFGDAFSGTGNVTPQQTYGLAFVGVDGYWGSSDDKAVKQNPETPFDLSKLNGGDTKTREITQKKRELQKMLKSLEGKEEQYAAAVTRTEKALADNEADLKKVCTQKKLRTLEQVKADKVASEQLLLVGETRKLLMVTEKKLENARDTKAQLSVKIKRLANQEELSKLAESKEELAMLDQLLSESRAVLEEKSSLGELDKLTEEQAADDWFRENFGK